MGPSFVVAANDNSRQPTGVRPEHLENLQEGISMSIINIRNPFTRRVVLCVTFLPLAVGVLACGAVAGALRAADDVQRAVKNCWKGRSR